MQLKTLPKNVKYGRELKKQTWLDLKTVICGEKTEITIFILPKKRALDHLKRKRKNKK